MGDLFGYKDEIYCWLYPLGTDQPVNRDRKALLQKILDSYGVTKAVDLPLEGVAKVIARARGVPLAGDLLRGDSLATPALPLSDLAQEFNHALTSPGHHYHGLATTLLGAFEQAAMGKGKERHAHDLPFAEQKILQLPKQQGHVGGLLYQVAKKALESERMTPAARVRELNGVIVYASAAILFTEGQDE